MRGASDARGWVAVFDVSDRGVAAHLSADGTTAVTSQDGHSLVLERLDDHCPAALVDGDLAVLWVEYGPTPDPDDDYRDVIFATHLDDDGELAGIVDVDAFRLLPGEHEIDHLTAIVFSAQYWRITPWVTVADIDESPDTAPASHHALPPLTPPPAHAASDSTGSGGAVRHQRCTAHTVGSPARKRQKPTEASS